MGKSNNIERSDLWNNIHDIVKQIPRAKIIEDAPDAPSVATELEGLFLKNLSLGNVINCNTCKFSDRDIYTTAMCSSCTNLDKHKLK